MMAGRDFAGEVPTEEILVANLSVGAEWLSDSERVRALEDGLRQLSGVRAAAVATGAPGFFENWGPLELDGVVYERPEDRDRISWNAVTSGYFTRLGTGRARERKLRPSIQPGP